MSALSRLLMTPIASIISRSSSEPTKIPASINRRLLETGDRFRKGDALADSSSTKNGELALGRNLMVAFMPWRGYNFEDAIVISERVVTEDVYTSVHIDVHSIHVRDTKRGEEELTREIPNVSDEAVRNLDENGIIRVGSEVSESDILVGKITPKGETDPTPEEKLLRAIFGDKAGDVKDASLKLPPGSKGVVINSQLFSRRVITKDSDVRKEEKRRQEMLERQLKESVDTYTRMLAEKLDSLLENETSLGIRDLDGTTVIRAGTALKDSPFMTRFIDGADIGTLSTDDDWVDHKRKSELVRKAYLNYRMVVGNAIEDTEIEKNKVIQGDETPAGNHADGKGLRREEA